VDLLYFQTGNDGVPEAVLYSHPCETERYYCPCFENEEPRIGEMKLFAQIHI